MNFEKCMFVMIACLSVTGCATGLDDGEDAIDGELADEALGEAQEAVANTIHAIVTCESATLYGNYSPPKDPIRVLPYGDKVGLKPKSGNASWALVLDYGRPVWGFLLRSCITRCNGTNDPVKGCF